MSRGLTTRLRRLEKLHRPRRAKPLIVFSVMADEAPGPMTGLASLHDRVDRLYGEDDWPAFAERARAACGGARIMTATYAPAAAPVAASEAPRPAPAPPTDPFALAGIGRVDERYLGWHPSNASMVQP